MNTYSFIVYISEPNLNPDHDVNFDLATDQLYETCRDIEFEVSNGNWGISFDRKEESLADAIFSAIRDIEYSGIGSKVLKIIVD
jgi:hypothetical protein